MLLNKGQSPINWFFSDDMDRTQAHLFTGGANGNPETGLG